MELPNLRNAGSMPHEQTVTTSCSAQSCFSLESASHPASRFSTRLPPTLTGDAIRNLSPFITLTWLLLCRSVFNENSHKIKTEPRKERKMINILKQNEIQLRDGWGAVALFQKKKIWLKTLAKVSKAFLWISNISLGYFLLIIFRGRNAFLLRYAFRVHCPPALKHLSETGFEVVEWKIWCKEACKEIKLWLERAFGISSDESSNLQNNST